MGGEIAVAERATRRWKGSRRDLGTHFQTYEEMGVVEQLFIYLFCCGEISFVVRSPFIREKPMQLLYGRFPVR